MIGLFIIISIFIAHYFELLPKPEDLKKKALSEIRARNHSIQPIPSDICSEVRARAVALRFVSHLELKPLARRGNQLINVASAECGKQFIKENQFLVDLFLPGEVWIANGGQPMNVVSKADRVEAAIAQMSPEEQELVLEFLKQQQQQ